MEEDYPSDLDYGGYLLRKAVSYTEQDLLKFRSMRDKQM